MENIRTPTTEDNEEERKKSKKKKTAGNKNDDINIDYTPLSRPNRPPQIMPGDTRMSNPE